jgi:medium-chain acyl-[acyl-carrier-protein] hydrolase
MDALTDRLARLTPEKRDALAHLLGTRAPARRGDWIVRHGANEDAELRLFCFPYAGGGASIFRSWADALPDTVQVFGVQPPGRETRMVEPAHTRLTELIDSLGPAVLAHLDRPFAFYGHSMGALVAFELTRWLRRHGHPQPERLLLGAFRAPQLRNPNIKIYHLPDEVLKVVLRTDGTPQRILENEELMAVILPTLRADFELCDTYQHEVQTPLDIPFSIFAGNDDVRVSANDLRGWSEQTVSRCRFRRLPGGHFFLHSTPDLLIEAVSNDLSRGLTQKTEASYV